MDDTTPRVNGKFAKADDNALSAKHSKEISESHQSIDGLEEEEDL
jgi:hypothetical protein